MFHTWLYRNYIPQQFPKYVKNKIKAGVFLPGRGELLIAAVGRKELPGSPQLPSRELDEDTARRIGRPFYRAAFFMRRLTSCAGTSLFVQVAISRHFLCKAVFGHLLC